MACFGWWDYLLLSSLNCSTITFNADICLSEREEISIVLFLFTPSKYSKVFFNYMIDHIDIRELENIGDDPKVYLAITIHLKLNGYAPKYSIEYLKNINTGEKKKASHSKNDLLNGGVEGGMAQSGFYPFAVPEDSMLPHLAFRPLHNPAHSLHHPQDALALGSPAPSVLGFESQPNSKQQKSDYPLK